AQAPILCRRTPPPGAAPARPTLPAALRRPVGVRPLRPGEEARPGPHHPATPAQVVGTAADCSANSTGGSAEGDMSWRIALVSMEWPTMFVSSGSALTSEVGVSVSAAVGQSGQHFPSGQTRASKAKVRPSLPGAAGTGWIGALLGISN